MKEKIVIFNKGKRTFAFGKIDKNGNIAGYGDKEPATIAPGKTLEVDKDYAEKLLKSYKDLVDASKDFPQIKNLGDLRKENERLNKEILKLNNEIRDLKDELKGSEKKKGK